MKARSNYKQVGDKKIKWVVAHRTWPWGRYAVAKTDNYKKQNGKWKRYKTYCEAQAYGEVSDPAWGECYTSVNFNTVNGLYVFENNKKDVEHRMPVVTKTKFGWVKGAHKGAGGITYTSTLTW